MKKFISLLICYFILLTNVNVSFSKGMSTYENLMALGDEFIPRLTAAGATLEELEIFLDDMDAVVDSYQENIYLSDIDVFFITVLLQTLQLEENLPVLVAFDRDYQEEIIYMGTYKKVPDNMTNFKMMMFSGKLIVEVPDDEEEYVQVDREDIEPPEDFVDTKEPEIKEEEIILPFDDISSVPWCIESVLYLVDQGVVSGTGERTFEPDKPVSREEFLKMIVLATLEVNEVYFNEYGKSAIGKWFHPYLATAEFFSLTNGIYDYDVAEFKEDVSITREDMTTIAYRAMRRADIPLKDIKYSTDFMDTKDINYYAMEAIKELQEAGIIEGKGNNRFEPKSPTTRAEAAKIVYNIMKLRNVDK